VNGRGVSRFETLRSSARTVLGALMIGAAVVLFMWEKRRPLRRRTQEEPARTLRNLAMGAMSLAVVGLLQSPIVKPLAARVARRRLGLAQQLPGPAWLRDTAAFLLLDYTIYVWHVLTHKVPFLWRFHVVHHVDMDLDTTTALRFHAIDMALSIPWRAAQVRVCGASPRALQRWQTFFFVSVLFHHSNLRLPLPLERLLVRVLTTPRLHGIHHSIVQEETNSNWSSGLSFWDWLHGTLRVDVPQETITIGVPRYRDPAEVMLGPSLALPFVEQRDAWLTADGKRIERDPHSLGTGVFPAESRFGQR
jgi:sterol desaturase/sphingolipid hydroxylase (fatty acid hydroxylase superfamily)